MAKTPLHAVKDAFDPVFTRSQIEWALWRRGNDAKTKMSSSFRTQCKHLLEFDRTEPIRDCAFAFSDKEPGGSGEHSHFSFFDVIMLSAALSFLGVRFKRKDVVLFLRSRRALYRELFKPLMERELAEALGREKPNIADAGFYDLLCISVKQLDPGPIYAKGRWEVLRTKDEVAKVTRDFDSLVLLDVTPAICNLAPLIVKAPQRRRGPR